MENDATLDSPDMLAFGKEQIVSGLDTVLAWTTSPSGLTQIAWLIGAFLLAWVLTGRVKALLTRVLTPGPNTRQLFVPVMTFLHVFVPLVFPVLAFALTAIGTVVSESLFGSATVIALGTRVILLIAGRIFVQDVLQDGFLKFLSRIFLVPALLLNVFTLLDDVQILLAETVVELGNIRFDMLDIVRGLIAGGIIFWLGSWSNRQSSSYIGAQQMRPSTKELASKAAELSIFVLGFLILMNVVGLNLSALAVLGGAIGVGLGFGLQKIASNFISGIILLLEAQATVGDFVELDGGEAGKIVKMMARATILETFDGRWIVVPNEDFITTRVVNYSDSGSANRYEAPFCVSYDTDINAVPALVEAAVATHPEILDLPFPPDCELRAFGDSGVEFAVEFWVNGLDDGPNKFTSDVLFLIWNALKDEGIEIPYPQRVVHHKGLPAPQ